MVTHSSYAMPGTRSSNDPHRNQPVATAGVPLAAARAALILVHGRGATAQDMLGLAGALGQPDVAYLAPQAGGRTWYPASFLAPLAHNEPALSSGLRALGGVLDRVGAAGLPAARTVVLGFSQGACLALEFAARKARRYGGVVAFSGGLIGTGERPGAGSPDDKHFDYAGSLDGTPVFLGCADADPHIPRQRVHTSAEVLQRLGGHVTTRIYPGLGHAINEDEVAFVRHLLAELGRGAP